MIGLNPQEEKKRLELAKKEADEKQRQEDEKRRKEIIKCLPRKNSIKRGPRADYKHKRNINRHAPSKIKEIEKLQFAKVREWNENGEPGPVEHYPIKRIPIMKEIKLPKISLPEIVAPEIKKISWFRRLINCVWKFLSSEHRYRPMDELSPATNEYNKKRQAVRKTITVQTGTILEGGEPVTKVIGKTIKTIRIKRHNEEKRYKYQHRKRDPVLDYPDSKKFKKKKKD